MKLEDAARSVLDAAANEENPEAMIGALETLRVAVEGRPIPQQEAIDCLALRLDGADLLGDTKAEDLIEWLNLVEPDAEDLVRLEALAKERKFQAWDCPTCGERVYFARPDDWDHFQGVCQADHTSYPAGHVAQCDNCRCYKPHGEPKTPEILR